MSGDSYDPYARFAALAEQMIGDSTPAAAPQGSFRDSMPAERFMLRRDGTPVLCRLVRSPVKVDDAGTLSWAEEWVETGEPIGWKVDLV